MKNVHLLILFSFIWILSGCGTMMAFDHRKAPYHQRVYPATTGDAGMIYACITGQGIIHYGDCGNVSVAQHVLGYTVVPLCFLIDIPLSLTTDTLCLPYDIHRVSADQKPLVFAVEEGDIAEVRQLLANGADPNLVYACTPLIRACAGSKVNNWRGDVEMVKLLIAAGADVNLSDFSTTPLMSTRNYDIAVLLIKHGADVKYVSCNGSSVLMAAGCRIEKPLLELYVEKGVDLNAVNTDIGKTILDYVSKSREDELKIPKAEFVAYLKNHGAKTGAEIKATRQKNGSEAR